MLEVHVRYVRDEALDIRSFELVDPTGKPLPGFAAGAHIDVHVAPDVVRQYSLCNSPTERDRYVIAVKREVASRGGSLAMHELKAGSRLTIGEPRNNFPLSDDAFHHVLIAAGIGVTPILSMARDLASRGSSFELHYFVRSAAHAAFAGVLRAPPFARAVSIYDGMNPQGVALLARRLVEHRRPRAHAYVCGPAAFMDVVHRAAGNAWPTGTVHCEHFAPAPGSSASFAEFDVRLARSGLTLNVPAGLSIVQVLSAHGISVTTSCEQGLCGSCITAVLEGVPDHQDVILSEQEKAEGKAMCLCVSRSKTPYLVLDL